MPTPRGQARLGLREGLIGNPTKADAKFGRQPNMRFKKLVHPLIEANLAFLEGTPMHLVDSNISPLKHVDVLAEVPLPLVDGDVTALRATD